MKLQELFNESENKIVIADKGMTTSDVLHLVEIAMKEVAETFKNHKKSEKSVAAAPDTTKFRATVGGMIEVEHGVHIHGGQYGVSYTYPVFLKIGGGIDHKIVAKMKEELIDILSDTVALSAEVDVKIPGSIYCSNGLVNINTTSGTNWGGIGAKESKYSAYEKKQYDAAT